MGSVESRSFRDEGQNACSGVLPQLTQLGATTASFAGRQEIVHFERMETLMDPLPGVHETLSEALWISGAKLTVEASCAPSSAIGMTPEQNVSGQMTKPWSWN